MLIDRKTILIKIIEGVMIPRNLADKHELLIALENIIRERNSLRRVAGPKLEDILLNLVEHKGLLGSIEAFAMHSKHKIILLICGTHPNKWPEEFTDKINKLGEKLHLTLLSNIKERLISMLKQAPKNLIIIHTGDTTLKKLASKISTILKLSPKTR